LPLHLQAFLTSIGAHILEDLHVKTIDMASHNARNAAEAGELTLGIEPCLD
jgi:hypothetical protein